MWTIILAVVLTAALLLSAVWGVINARGRITPQSAKIRKFGIVLSVTTVAAVLILGTKVMLWGLIIAIPLGSAALAGLIVYTISAVYAQTKE
jgi:hypothetical protein